MNIRAWVQKQRPAVVLELGANVGQDTGWLAVAAGVVHAFEPDPRCPRPADLPRNVIWNAVAVADRDGTTRFIPSAERAGEPWTASGSILEPKEHLVVWPDVTFADPVTVQCVTLDTYIAFNSIESISFVWADVQGAEALMIAGGKRAFERTRWLYTEHSDVEWYAGQPTLAEILRMLGPAWRIHTRVTDIDVLLCNDAWVGDRLSLSHAARS